MAPLNKFEYNIDPDVAKSRSELGMALRWLNEDAAAEAARALVRAKRAVADRDAAKERAR